MFRFNKEDIQEKVKEELGERQREVYLREQLRAIQKELGEGDGAADDATKELKARLDALPLPADARKEVEREWARLTRNGRESMESQVIRTYLETIAELPWGTRTEELLDVQAAARILDACGGQGNAPAAGWAEVVARYHPDVAPGTVLYEKERAKTAVGRLEAAGGHFEPPSLTADKDETTVRFFLMNYETGILSEVRAARRADGTLSVSKKRA